MAEEQKGFEETLKDITTDLKRILTNRAVVLKGAYERDVILYKVMQSTLEGGAGQQEIRIKKLEEQLAKAQEVVEDNVQTILRLQMELKTSDAEVDSLLEQNEILYGKYSNTIDACPCCNNDVSFDGELRHVLSDTTASGRGMVEYPFNPEGEKEPYPYTHPIRDIGTSGKIKEKK